MTNFKLDSPYFGNIYSISQHEILNKICTVHINNKNEIQIPLLIAVSFSSLISQLLLIDPLTTDFYIEDHSLDNIQENIYDKLKILLNMKDIQLEDEEINQIAKVGKVLENDELVALFNNKIKTYEQNMNEENVISLVEQKISFDQPIEDFSSEIAFISSNFSIFIDKLAELGKDDKYDNLIEIIVRNEHLLLHSEDELLLFIISLCEDNNIYEILFEYVMLEYCSVETIKQFIEYINNYICKDYHHKSILKCINRRLTQEKIPLEKSDEQRYTKLPDIFESIQKGKLIEVQYLIEKKYVDIDIKDKNDNSMIHIASINGHLPIVQYLIEKQNVDVNIKGWYKKTPLHRACEEGHFPIVEYLISKGANIEAKVTLNGWTPLHLASIMVKQTLSNT